MFPREIEVILTRHLASCIAIPMFVVDPEGNVIFYNEAAERLIGRRYEEDGTIPPSVWASAFSFKDDEGRSIPPQELPLTIALVQKRPAYRAVWGQALDGTWRHVGVTAFPLIGQKDRFLGAVCIFWEQ